jgi:DNA-binding SARP family transcriptional activator
VNNLKLKLLGTFQLTINEEPIRSFGYEKIKGLLAYLVTEADSSHDREEIATMFWPTLSSKAARVNLRRALSNLRNILKETKEKSRFLLSDRQSIGFNFSKPHDIDLANFQELVSAGSNKQFRLEEICPQTVTNLEKAVCLYSGVFLSQVRIDDSELFDNWLRLKRQQLHQQAVDACTMLLTYSEKHYSLPDMYRHAQKLLELEPWNETAHESLMKLFATNRKRSAALLQYQRYQQVLHQELGAKPERRMVKLYEKIIQGEFPPPKSFL